MRRFVDWFETSRAVAAVLTTFGWFWTAYECDTIGIDVFDAMLKRFPGQLWIMAIVLSWLTVIWMPKNLSVRALTGLMMLTPAELFKATRAFRPAEGFAAVHVFVVFAYLIAVIGMYGMFYPWRLEKGFALLAARPGLLRCVGAVAAALGAAMLVIGFRLG